ncbi:MAG: mannose-1-phosphate guanylyltransferase [Oscillospiraceae bacterium]|nr:mannose-1-phosphate guanylyltransferase [Oscillospiraceae bacterium]
MIIILLSGGSGKRLWPLSSETMPKQFIKWFTNAEAERESLLQRIYRQITTVSPGADVLIAASKLQIPEIRDQLGDKVTICVEPSRKDTFPAIVLAASYLFYERRIPSDEVVAVCPVDPYVENTYYESVFSMEALVKADTAALTLMGVEPTGPSEKFGYILPAQKEPVSPVRAFVEKPDQASAQRYIAEGALWNAGVFAFRLGYILEKAHRVIDFTDYSDLYDRYDSLPGISFDFAVAEKETSIQVLRYSGAWRDIGSWESLSEVVEQKAIGKAVLDENCRNVSIVNHLEIPILVMGGKDLLVVASRDGILISDKPLCGSIKPYVEALHQEDPPAETP